MAAVLTLGTVAVAANGKTVTATISGGTGSGRTITNATGILIKLSAGVTPTFPIGTVGVVGSTLTVTLTQPIGSGETATLDISTGSNLTDSGANTATGQTGVAITNNSTTAVTFYTCDSGSFEMGLLGEVTTNGGWNVMRDTTRYVENIADYAVEWVSDGLEYGIICYGGAVTTARIDGGSQATVTSDVPGFWNIKPITTSALAAGKHLVCCDFGDYFYGVRVTGGTRTMYAVPTTRRTILANTKAYVAIPQATPIVAAGAYKVAAVGEGRAQTQSYVGIEADFSINGTGIEIMGVAHSGSSWAVEVDGGQPGLLAPAGDATINNLYAYQPLRYGLTVGTHTFHCTFVAAGTNTTFLGVRATRGTKLASLANSGSGTLSVSDTTYLAINDWVRIDSYSKREWRKITNITGAGPFTLTLNANTAIAHAVGAQVTSYSATAATMSTYQKVNRSNKKYLALGDSNIQGWNTWGANSTLDGNGNQFAFYDPRTTGCYQAATALASDLINLGVQGWTSANVLAASADYNDVNDYSHGLVDGVILWIGVNDINGTSISPTTYQNQVESIVIAASNILKPEAKIYLLPPLAPATTNAGGLNKATALTALQNVAALYPFQVVCISTLAENIAPGDQNSLHFEPSGQQKIGYKMLTGLNQGLMTGFMVANV